MKTRYIVVTLICVLLLVLAAIIAARADPIEPVAPTIHTEAPDVREAPDDVAADAEPTTCDATILFNYGGGERT